MSQLISLIGYASGAGGNDARSEEAADVLQRSSHLKALAQAGLQLQWNAILKLPAASSKLLAIQQLNQALAEKTSALTREKKFFVVLGGDHSSAIGTWSGVQHAKKKEGPIGLIWIDAHMDSHTFVTTPSGNIHGMPVAALLGYGDPTLTKILNAKPKIRPEHLCLIGVRNYEKEEAELLKKLNIKIFFMNEVKKYGLKNIMREAIRIVTHGTVGYGVSIDVDSLDPRDAPGTSTAEPNGIAVLDLCEALKLSAKDSRFIGAEIVEFNPSLDEAQVTEKTIANMIAAMRTPVQG